MMEAIAKAEAPPPDGSMATNACLTVRSGCTGSTPQPSGGRARKASTSALLNAFVEPSDPIPMVSRRSIACKRKRSRNGTRAGWGGKAGEPVGGRARTGSSESSARTVSTLALEIHLGKLPSLWRHSSGFSVARQASQTSEICIERKTWRPLASLSAIILE